MSLRHKIVLILVVVVGLYGLATDQVQRHVFTGRFEEIERREAREDLDRVVEALEAEISTVDEIAKGWASWDDTREFLRGERTEEYSRSNLGPEFLARRGIDLLYFLGPVTNGEARVRWSVIRDPDSGTPLALRDFPTGSFLATHPLLVRADWQREVDEAARPVGILLTEAELPLIVSTHPIVGSDGLGEPVGTLVLGRFLGAGVRDRLSQQTRVPFDAWQIDGRAQLDPAARAVLDEATGSTEPVVRVVDDDTLHVYATFSDLRHRPEILLRAYVDRGVTQTGATAFTFGLVSNIAGGFVMLLALTLLLQRIVLAPLGRLTAHAVRIGQQEDFRAELAMDRSDEIGTLSREFDGMMAKLEQARSELVDTARSAGKSEIAAGILHNVGNVLNSVNISTALIAQIVDDMSVADLEKVSEVLAANGDDLGRFVTEDPQGRHLAPFLAAISGQLGEERQTLAQELSSLSDGIEHICELIKSQQSFAVKTSLEEELQLAERLEEAVRITQQASHQDPDLKIIREYEELPDVLVDKHRLLEILVNLVQNARQSMWQSDAPSTLRLSIERHGERVRIRVSDSGAGIPADVLPKIFNLGFTTKKKGHGYGLHTAANAAAEMGGTLHAESDGPGRGATFVLDLPMKSRVRTGGAV